MIYHMVAAYLVIINLCAFFLFGLDKYKSKRSAWRIAEATLFAFAWLGGGIGAWCGMYAFRHKTKHKKFVFGIPAILLGEVLLIALFILYIL